MDRKVALLAAIAAGAAAYTYMRVVRPWHLTWGATPEEVARPMPGDDMVQRPTFNATRAITINARPEDIWPWLVQMGFGRAGWYSYDWLDNLGRPSAQRIVPELQRLQVGDRVPMSRWTYFTVRSMEPNRWMVWESQDSSSTWAWALYPLDERRTRLVTRIRVLYRWTSPAIVLTLFLMELGDPIMIRKELLGIKRRAEQPRQVPAS